MAFTLTAQQAKVKAFLIDYMDRNHGLAPSFDEITEGVGLSSKSGVHRIMQALIERGHVQTIPGRARAIRILPDAKNGDGNE